MPERRRYLRQRVNPPVYVDLGLNNGGRLRDLSEGGFAFDVWGPALPDELLRLKFDLLEVDARVEASATLTWSARTGRTAGMRFVDLPGRSHQQIKEWLILSSLATSLGKSPIEVREPVRPTEPPKGDMTGKWKLSYTSPEGPEEATADLTMAPDGALTGTGTSSRGTAPLVSGWVSGDRFSFTISVPLGGTPSGVIFSGTLEGNSIKGSISVEPEAAVSGSVAAGSYADEILAPETVEPDGERDEESSSQRIAKDRHHRPTLPLKAILGCIVVSGLGLLLALGRTQHWQIRAGGALDRREILTATAANRFRSETPNRSDAPVITAGNVPTSAVREKAPRATLPQRQQEGKDQSKARLLVAPKTAERIPIASGEERTEVPEPNLPATAEGGTLPLQSVHSGALLSGTPEPAKPSEPGMHGSKSEGVQQALLVHRVEPIYPEFAKQRHLEGTVRLRATIGRDGAVRSIEVISGPMLLAEAAQDAVSQWRYRPTLLNGEPVEAKTEVMLSFHLEGSSSEAVRRISRREGVQQPLLVHRVEPIYPELARQDRLEGAVRLHVVIGREGSVRSLGVLSGHRLLARAALDAVSQWRYQPTLLNGQAIEVDTEVTVGFYLGERSPEPVKSSEAGQRQFRSKGVQQGLLVHRVEPTYPEFAKQNRLEGTVRLRAVIGRDGTVRALEILSGHTLLAQAARDAVSQWRYRPTLLNGEPVEVRTEVTVVFHLHR